MPSCSHREDFVVDFSAEWTLNWIQRGLGTHFCGGRRRAVRSLFAIPNADARCGKHQHRKERVHDLLQSLHWNSPLYELRKTPPIHPGRAEAPERMCTLFFTFQIDHGECADSHLSFFPSIYIRCKKCPHIAIEACLQAFSFC